MAASTRLKVKMVDAVCVRSVVTACCAPMTSVLSLLTSDPVWARVKKASGCRCTWPNTLVRRS
jgi:hypothetical protein